jgi:hypothetical protein
VVAALVGTQAMSQLVSREWYSINGPDGYEHDVRWLRVGRGRWWAEIGKWGIAVRLGPVHLTLHFDPREDDA